MMRYEHITCRKLLLQDCHVRNVFSESLGTFVPREVYVKPTVKSLCETVLHNKGLGADSHARTEWNSARCSNRDALNWPCSCGCETLLRISCATAYGTSTICCQDSVGESHGRCLLLNVSGTLNVCGTFDALRAVYTCVSIQSTAIDIATMMMSSTRYFHHSLCEEPSHTAIVR